MVLAGTLLALVLLPGPWTVVALLLAIVLQLVTAPLGAYAMGSAAYPASDPAGAGDPVRLAPRPGNIG